MRVVCIANPFAGPKRNAPALVKLLHESGARAGWDVNCLLTERLGDATCMAREASTNADLVIAMGGDGTVHEVAEGLLGGTAALGVIPAGSGNGFARSLGIPVNPARAIAELADGEARSIDVGMVNDRPFFATASIGIDAAVTYRYRKHGKRFRGLVPYIWHTVVAWFTYHPAEVKLTIDGTTTTERPLTLFAANTSQYGYGAQIAPDAVPDDGLLLVGRLDRPTVAGVLLLLPRLFTGTIGESRHYRSDAARELIVERETPGLMQIDGDPLEAGQVLKFGILLGALKVWLPRRS